jgi:hypothetical protein
MTTGGDAAAWQALMPTDITWLGPRRLRRGEPIRHQLSGLPSGAPAGVARRGWLVGSTRRLRKTGVVDVHTYLALPSCRRPVIVADRDPALLRYVGEALLSVPPGAGPLMTLVGTIGLRLLGLPGGWVLARAVLPGGAAIGRLA